MQSQVGAGRAVNQFPKLVGVQASPRPMPHMKYADGTCGGRCLLHRIVHVVSTVAFSVQQEAYFFSKLFGFLSGVAAGEVSVPGFESRQ